MVEFTQRRSCPAGTAACPRDIGQRTSITWAITAPKTGLPDSVRVKIEGSTIDAWNPGMWSWQPQVTPFKLLTDAVWRLDVFSYDFKKDGPRTDREATFACKRTPLENPCGLVDIPGQPPLNPPVRRWFWVAPGTRDVVVTALKDNDGTLTEMCKVTRTYTVAPLDHSDPDRQAVDYYINGGTGPINADDFDAPKHLRWHTVRDKQGHFMGEDWLAFHRMMVKSFDDWRALFGYPPVTPYDGSTSVPNSDGGFSMVDVTRPKTTNGNFVPSCYGPSRFGCRPQPWFTEAGDGTARGDDLGTKKCHYLPDRHDVVEEVPTGQRKLADFKDARGLGCVVNGTHHRFMHEANDGTFHFLVTTPRDPLFWAYHKFASGYGPAPLPLGGTARARPAAAPTESILTAWERVKAEGPPGITAVFPPKGISVPRLPGIQVLFWEQVTGVRASDLTVNGSPATSVVGNGVEFVFSGFDVPDPPPAGGSISLAIELATGAIEDLQGTPFPSDGWQFHLEHDADGDDITDDLDNCPDAANPTQENTDTLAGATFGEEHGEHGYGNGFGDELGDACDPDDDGDLVTDAVELATGSDPLDWRSPDPCPLDPNKTDPGPCGCGILEVGSGDSLTCVIGPVCEVAEGAAPPVHHVTPSGVEVTPPGCDDADPCSSDECVEPTGCANTELVGFDGLDCRVGRLLEPALCGADPVDAKLGKFLGKKAKAARTLVGKAESATKDGKRRKLLKKSDALLRKLRKKVDAALRKEKITPACGDTLGDLIDDARRLVPSLVP